MKFFNKVNKIAKKFSFTPDQRDDAVESIEKVLSVYD